MGIRGVTWRALRFWISSSRMTFKLILPLCLASMAFGRWLGSCYIKTDSTKTRSNLMRTYWYDDVESCRRAEAEVPRRCLGAFPKLTNEFVAKNICRKVEGNIPANDP